MALLPSSILLSRESNIEGFRLPASDYLPRSGVRFSQAKLSSSARAGRQGAVQKCWIRQLVSSEHMLSLGMNIGWTLKCTHQGGTSRLQLLKTAISSSP